MTAPGDGGYSAIDPADPVNTWYSSYIEGVISKTTNGSTPWSPTSGPNWVQRNNGMLNDVVPPNVEEDEGPPPVVGAIFIAPFTMDPQNHLNLLAGADRPYLTTNGAELWRDISGATRFFQAPGGQEGPGISATTICPIRPMAGSSTLGRLTGACLSRQMGSALRQAWSDISTGLPGQWVTRVVCPTAGGPVYATIGGSQTQQGTHVFQKSGGANVWTSIHWKSPECDGYNPRGRHPRRRAGSLCTTDLGVYLSFGGNNWATLRSGPSECRRGLSSARHNAQSATQRNLWPWLVEHSVPPVSAVPPPPRPLLKPARHPSGSSSPALPPRALTSPRLREFSNDRPDRRPSAL